MATYSPKGLTPVPTDWELIPATHLWFYAIALLIICGIIFYAVVSGRSAYALAITRAKIRKRKYLDVEFLKRRNEIKCEIKLKNKNKSILEINAALSEENGELVGELEFEFFRNYRASNALLINIFSEFLEYSVNNGLHGVKFSCAPNSREVNKTAIILLVSEGFRERNENELIVFEKKL